MKLVRYLSEGHARENRECYGLMAFDEVICPHDLAKMLSVGFPPTLEGLVTLGASAVERAENSVKSASRINTANASLPVSQVTLLAPIAFPPKIICLGLNYRDHALEAGATIPDEPIIFMKPHTTIIGPNESIIKPSFVKKLDYEAELAIIIGRRAKNVAISEAKSCVFGYTILNDVSARDIQFKDKQWTRGKASTLSPQLDHA